MNYSILPPINAILNSISFTCLVIGYWAIKNKNEKLHKALMISALFFSAIFLSCYLVYHSHVGSVPFPDLGFIKTIYLCILVPHIILAAVMVPMILKTFWHAFRGERDKHKRIAKITLPIWLFVSISGVVVYLMLYQWFRV